MPAIRNHRAGNVEQWKSCSADLGPRCANCGIISLEMFACDYTAGGNSNVCNMVLCDACAQPQGDDKHFCPAHSGMKIVI